MRNIKCFEIKKIKDDHPNMYLIFCDDEFSVNIEGLSSFMEFLIFRVIFGKQIRWWQDESWKSLDLLNQRFLRKINPFLDLHQKFVELFWKAWVYLKKSIKLLFPAFLCIKLLRNKSAMIDFFWFLFLFFKMVNLKMCPRALKICIQNAIMINYKDIK